MGAKAKARRTASTFGDWDMQATQQPERHQTKPIGAYPEIDEPSQVRQRISVPAGAFSFTLALTLFLFAAQAILGIQPASARSHYGILGREAPELTLDTWVDGRGAKMAPIHLRDNRGKVIIDPSGKVVYNGFHIAADRAVALIQKLVAGQQP